MTVGWEFAREAPTTPSGILTEPPRQFQPRQCLGVRFERPRSRPMIGSSGSSLWRVWDARVCGAMVRPPNRVLLRGFRNRIAERVGNVFRHDLCAENEGVNLNNLETNAAFSEFCERWRGGTGSRVAGCFGARGERRTHVLKNRNVGNSSAIFLRGGGKGCFGGARRAGSAPLFDGGRNTAHGGITTGTNRVGRGCVP